MTHTDLPPQALLQQSSARPVSGEELETFGKHAAKGFACGNYCSMQEAVVETVKHAGLSPEQVRRVCEFANTAAFISEFNKESTAAKYVSFPGGPASFSEVIKDLNDGGGGTVFDRGMADYAGPPVTIKVARARMSALNAEVMSKTAGVEVAPSIAGSKYDDVLAEAFNVTEKAAGVRYANPLADIEDMRMKLASASEHTESEINSIETAMLTVNEDLYFQVKQACLDGHQLGHILQLWNGTCEVNPDLVKQAFALIGPRLVEDEVFPGYDALGESLSAKVASSRHVVEGHPLTAAFAAYSEGIHKLAELRATYMEFQDGLDKVDTFIHQAHLQYPEHV